MEPSVKGFREEFRAWCAEALPPEWRHLSHGTDDETLIEARLGWGRRLHQGGWAGVRIPTSCGGLGLSTAHHLATIEEQVRLGAPEPLNLNSIEILAPLIVEHGTEWQQHRYLPPMLSHEQLWCQGFSEPDAGSDLASLQTRARPVAGGWLLSGQKVWTTYGPQADYAYVLVRTNPAAPKHAGISLMILPMDQSGVTVRPLRNIAGSLEFSEVFLDEAKVPSENLVGALDAGWPLAISALASERGLNMVQRGLHLEREVEALRSIVADADAGQDTAAGRASSSLCWRIVDCFIDARAMRSIAYEILDAAAVGPVPPTLASIAKLHWSETHQAVLGLGVEAMEDRVNDPRHAEWVRAALFSRAETIYGGTSEIQRNLLAREMGLPSDR